jgi:hypothetical protein
LRATVDGWGVVRPEADGPTQSGAATVAARVGCSGIAERWV